MARLYRDDHGIPHVRGTDVLDVAHGHGAVTARDRTWQLEWLRRRAEGTTAALVGPAGLDWDLLARRTRLPELARRAHAALDEESRAFVAAYAAGVNDALAEPDLPPARELAGLSAEPRAWEPWTPVGVFLAQHLLFANLGGKLWAQRAADALGADAVLLDPEGPDSGSNAWAVGGARTASGLPLVGGDPHRIIEQPGVYQQVRLACEDPDDRFDVVGFAFVGVPGTPHFAHAGDVAWAITNGMGDYQDLYDVVLDATTVRERRVETVEVAGADDVAVEVLAVEQGEVVEGDLATGRGLALRTAVGVLGDCGLGALLPLLRARSAADVDAAWEGWVEPVNNVVVADRTGDVRYRLAGRVPLRAEANRHGVVDPDGPGAAWSGWLDPLPRTAVPPDGDVVTANERRGPESEAVGASFAGPYRADRIRSLLAGRTGLTVDDFARIHDDAWLDPRARLDALTGAGDDGEDAADWLPGWDGVMDAGSADAATYAAWRSALVRRIVAEPVLDALRAPAPSSVLAPFLDLTARVGRALPALVAAGRPWGVDLAAHARAAREEVLAARARGDLPLTWGETHVLDPVHALDAAEVPAVPVSGDSDCVRCTASYPALSDRVARGSVARYAWDLADREASGWVVPTGACGDPDDPHHHDQLDAWAAGRLLPVVTAWDRLREVGPVPAPRREPGPGPRGE